MRTIKNFFVFCALACFLGETVKLYPAKGNANRFRQGRTAVSREEQEASDRRRMGGKFLRQPRMPATQPRTAPSTLSLSRSTAVTALRAERELADAAAQTSVRRADLRPLSSAHGVAAAHVSPAATRSSHGSSPSYEPSPLSYSSRFAFARAKPRFQIPATRRQQMTSDALHAAGVGSLLTEQDLAANIPLSNTAIYKGHYGKGRISFPLPASSGYRSDTPFMVPLRHDKPLEGNNPYAVNAYRIAAGATKDVKVRYDRKLLESYPWAPGDAAHRPIIPTHDDDLDGSSHTDPLAGVVRLTGSFSDSRSSGLPGGAGRGSTRTKKVDVTTTETQTDDAGSTPQPRHDVAIGPSTMPKPETRDFGVGPLDLERSSARRIQAVWRGKAARLSKQHQRLNAQRIQYAWRKSKFDRLRTSDAVAARKAAAEQAARHAKDLEKARLAAEEDRGRLLAETTAETERRLADQAARYAEELRKQRATALTERLAATKKKGEAIFKVKKREKQKSDAEIAALKEQLAPFREAETMGAEDEYSRTREKEEAHNPRAAAAVRVQKIWRGYATRSKFEKQKAAATLIQTAWRGKKARKRVEEMKEKAQTRKPIFWQTPDLRPKFRSKEEIAAVSRRARESTEAFFRSLEKKPTRRRMSDPWPRRMAVPPPPTTPGSLSISVRRKSAAFAPDEDSMLALSQRSDASGSRVSDVSSQSRISESPGIAELGKTRSPKRGGSARSEADAIGAMMREVS